jgi:transposase
MKYIESLSRAQIVLFPEKLDDLVSEENPVRVIDEFINQLDLEKLGFDKTRMDSSLAGRPCYSPECLLKLYIYGYFKKTRTSRKLMELCITNIEVMWMLGRLTPDFRTISDFRKDNTSAIKKVFKAFVQLCIEMGLYNKEVWIQDGSKFRAVNSKDNNATECKLHKKLQIAEARIEKYLKEMEENDKEESDTPKYTKEEINEKIEKLRGQKEKYNKLLYEMKEEGVTQKSFTDPDSRLMKSANGGFDVSYNVQILVDPKSHMVGLIEVTNQCNDLGQLSPVTAKVKEELGVTAKEVAADTGYEDNADMLKCIMNGTIPHVPSKTRKANYEFELDYEESSITEEMLNSTEPKDMQTCLKAGVLPNVYKDKGIEVSIHEVEQYVSEEVKTSQACFTLNEGGTGVTCPNGSTLNKVSRLHKKDRTRFTSRSACKECTEKCTTSSFKQVDLKDGQTILQTNKRQKVKKVKIILSPDKEKMRKRKCVVEHPFGTIKRWCDGYYTLLKGKEKVATDISLLFLGYNLKRAINMLGPQELIEKMRQLMGRILSYFSNFIQFPKIWCQESISALVLSNFRTVWDVRRPSPTETRHCVANSPSPRRFAAPPSKRGRHCPHRKRGGCHGVTGVAKTGRRRRRQQ